MNQLCLLVVFSAPGADGKKDRYHITTSVLLRFPQARISATVYCVNVGLRSQQRLDDPDLAISGG